MKFSPSRRVLLISQLIILIFLAACQQIVIPQPDTMTEDSMASDTDAEAMMDDDQKDTDEEMEAMTDEMMAETQLKLDISGLENLGDGWAYEGWIIVDGQPVTTGLFTVDGEGQLSTTEFPVDEGHLTNATAFVLTIEPSPDPDPAPSAVHILAGDITDGAADLTLDHPAALGNDFTAANGTYILGIGAPVSATAENSYVNGIWFDKLDLPELPAGWAYEGWVVGEDGPITTGRFTATNAKDEDGSGPNAGGPGTGPNFPGQDYLTPPTNLIGQVAVISIEPVPDNSPAPFTLKPLFDGDIEDVGDHGSQAFENNAAASSPTGTATILQ